MNILIFEPCIYCFSVPAPRALVYGCLLCCEGSLSWLCVYLYGIDSGILVFLALFHSEPEEQSPVYSQGKLNLVS